MKQPQKHAVLQEAEEGGNTTLPCKCMLPASYSIKDSGGQQPARCVAWVDSTVVDYCSEHRPPYQPSGMPDDWTVLGGGMQEARERKNSHEVCKRRRSSGGPHCKNAQAT
eukprot:GHRQ01028947.1.p1 GENE.GHRQ01028947.1~~GHRQ01028947.1.p1  ORF type:complete len:110 (+),score=9.93 GHRQ01028947.1:293-622(+)